MGINCVARNGEKKRKDSNIQAEKSKTQCLMHEKPNVKTKYIASRTFPSKKNITTHTILRRILIYRGRVT